MGHTVALGYMVDIRSALPDGTANPHFRKYTPFAVCRHPAGLFPVIQAVQWQSPCNISPYRTARPLPPGNSMQDSPPSGFIFPTNLEKRSSLTGKLMLSQFGFRNVFRNAIYIGCWAVNRVIVDYHNHEPIIPLDLFMFAFNRLSPGRSQGNPIHTTRLSARGYDMTSGNYSDHHPPIAVRYSHLIHLMAVCGVWDSLQIKWQGYTYAVTDKDRIKVRLACECQCG